MVPGMDVMSTSRYAYLLTIDMDSFTQALELGWHLYGSAMKNLCPYRKRY